MQGVPSGTRQSQAAINRNCQAPHAPYGKRAEEVLKAAGLWSKVEAKLVMANDLLELFLGRYVFAQVKGVVLTT